MFVNAMTIDVEDYFHVSVFDGRLPRHEWSQLESRVCANTERLLEIFADIGVGAKFFVFGWVAERHPALVQRIAALGHHVRILLKQFGRWRRRREFGRRNVG